MSKPDLEALVTSKISEAVRAAVDRVGRGEFETMTGIDDQHLASIFAVASEYVPVALVTLACQINRNHKDPNLSHTSVTECLKGSTIRIPPLPGKPKPPTVESSGSRRRLQKLTRNTSSSQLYDTKTIRLLGFSANLASFLILGYFLGGIAISPLLGESSCIGVSTSPPSLAPCGGSLAGLVISAIGGLAYTVYYFVKKL